MHPQDCIRQYRPDAAEVSLEPITTGKFNTSYFVRAGEEELVLRIAPPDESVFVFYEKDMMRQEPGIHQLLLEKTSVPVAPVVAFDESRAVIDRSFLILERLPGQAMSEAPVARPETVLSAVGECLAEVHQLTADRYGYLGEHAPMEPQATWAEAFQVMWNKLIDDVAATGHYSREEGSSLRSLLDRHLSLFDRPVPSSLLHMDIWSQNILVDERGHLSGLVDWDRALWGDPEIEFAVLDYCGISEPAFWEGYGVARDESPEAQVRRVFYLLYEIQKYIVIRHGRSNAPAAARGYKRQVLGIVAEAFG